MANPGTSFLKRAKFFLPFAERVWSGGKTAGVPLLPISGLFWSTWNFCSASSWAALLSCVIISWSVQFSNRMPFLLMSCWICLRLLVRSATLPSSSNLFFSSIGVSTKITPVSLAVFFRLPFTPAVIFSVDISTGTEFSCRGLYVRLIEL